MKISESDLRELIRSVLIKEGPSWDSFRSQADMTKEQPHSTDSIKVRSIVRSEIIKDVQDMTGSYVYQSYNQRSGNIDFGDSSKNWHCQIAEVRFKYKDSRRAKSIQREILKNYKRIYRDHLNVDIDRMVREDLYNGGRNSESVVAGDLLDKMSRFELLARMGKDITFIATKSKKKAEEDKIYDIVKQRILSRASKMFNASLETNIYDPWIFASEDKYHDESKRVIDTYSPNHFYDKEDFLKMRQVYDSAVMICREYFGGTQEDYDRQITDDDYGSEEDEVNPKDYNRDDYLNYLDEIIDEDLPDEGKEELRDKISEIFPNGFGEAKERAMRNYIEFSFEKELEEFENSYFKNIITEEDLNPDHESLFFHSGAKEDPYQRRLPRVKNTVRPKKGRMRRTVPNPESIFSYYFITVFRGDDNQFEDLVVKVCNRYRNLSEEPLEVVKKEKGEI